MSFHLPISTLPQGLAGVGGGGLSAV